MITLESVKFRGHRCFRGEWSGFDEIRPINVIIGRNNSGKSHLLDLVEHLCQEKLGKAPWEFAFEAILEEDVLHRWFPRNQSQGALGGRHWDDHGIHFVGQRVRWETSSNLTPTTFEFINGLDVKSGFGDNSTQARLATVEKGLGDVRHEIQHKFAKRFYRRLLADRDIRPELTNGSLELSPSGDGASRIIRKYILTSNPEYPREVIQVELLDALNAIFGQDGKFSEIQVKEHDNQVVDGQSEWEVFLGEPKKGLVPLSNSGSGLKTVFLVLLNLLVVPKLKKKRRADFVFAFEELENNLHPALLRRLFAFIEDYAVAEGVPIFLTTHSSTALDLFGVSKNAQIIHVSHDGESAKAVTVEAHFDHLGVISELGAKPSDLLQANGIIWVEGPSDCIYINRWLDLYSGGKFQEGRDYQCAFYGGSLLARTQFTSPKDAENELVNLFRVNPNIVVVCDGDRTGKGMRVKDRVRRIRAEVKSIPGAHIWVTDAKEIENYVPGPILSSAMGINSLPDPGQYEVFFPRKSSPGSSYVERRMKRKSVDKMDLAILAVPEMTKAEMVKRFEWEAQMKQITERIEAWNR